MGSFRSLSHIWVLIYLLNSFLEAMTSMSWSWTSRGTGKIFGPQVRKRLMLYDLRVNFFLLHLDLKTNKVNIFLILVQEKEKALNWTVEVFCRLVKQHTNVGQLITMYAEDSVSYACFILLLSAWFTICKWSILSWIFSKTSHIIWVYLHYLSSRNGKNIISCIATSLLISYVW